MQWKAAHAGNTGMLIWLGKQYLGQADKRNLRHGAEDDVPMTFTLDVGDMEPEDK